MGQPEEKDIFMVLRENGLRFGIAAHGRSSMELAIMGVNI